jgi:hypothetical protein
MNATHRGQPATCASRAELGPRTARPPDNPSAGRRQTRRRSPSWLHPNEVAQVPPQHQARAVDPLPYRGRFHTQRVATSAVDISSKSPSTNASRYRSGNRAMTPRAFFGENLPIQGVRQRGTRLAARLAWPGERPGRRSAAGTPRAILLAAVCGRDEASAARWPRCGTATFRTATHLEMRAGDGIPAERSPGARRARRCRS